MKKRNTFTFAASLVLLILAVLGCGDTGKEAPAGSGNSSGSGTSSGETGGSRGSRGSPAPDLSTPTGTHAALYQAMKSRDIDLYKRVSSKCYLDTIISNAKARGVSLDEFIKQSMDVVPASSVSTPEVRGEKISGSQATLEEKDFTGSGKWNEIPFVKESGEWKYNFLCD